MSIKGTYHVIGNPRFQYKNDSTIKKIGRSAINDIMEVVVLKH